MPFPAPWVEQGRRFAASALAAGQSGGFVEAPSLGRDTVQCFPMAFKPYQPLEGRFPSLASAPSFIAHHRYADLEVQLFKAGGLNFVIRSRICGASTLISTP